MQTPPFSEKLKGITFQNLLLISAPISPSQFNDTKRLPKSNSDYLPYRYTLWVLMPKMVLKTDFFKFELTFKDVYC